MATTQISYYRLIVRSGSTSDYQHDLISLYDGTNRHIANLKFTDKEAPGKSTTSGYTTVVYPRSQYLHAVDLLRHEKPVYFVEDNAIEAGLRTQTGEPVGESE